MIWYNLFQSIVNLVFFACIAIGGVYWLMHEQYVNALLVFILLELMGISSIIRDIRNNAKE
jgi:hypothetical protein